MKNGTSFPMSIQWQLVPYAKYGNLCPIQNMETRAKCHIMASVHRRVSQSSCPPLELLGAPPKSIFLFFELEEARLFWLL